MTVALVLSFALVFAVATAVAWVYQTANRLNRLHIRYDLSWQALDAALARRAVVARAVAAEGHGTEIDRHRLAALADIAEQASRATREEAENQLSAALAGIDPAALPPALVSESADAETRVLLARRFHNDAVRDTVALRERSLVRLLRLSGTAPLPAYFEIAERAGQPAQTTRAAQAELTGPENRPAAAPLRVAARVILLDESGRVLLLSGSDPALPDNTDRQAPRWWITVGGGVLNGESLAQAAARELAEETGLRVAPHQLIGPIWRREAVFTFNGETLNHRDFFFAHRTRGFEPSGAARTGLEHSYLHGYRWCDASEIAELAAQGQTVYPVQLGELLTEANAIADGAATPEQPQPIN